MRKNDFRGYYAALLTKNSKTSTKSNLSMDKIHGIGELVAPSTLNFYKNRVKKFIDNITAL